MAATAVALRVLGMDDESPTPCDYCGAPLGSGPLRDAIMILAEKGFPIRESDMMQHATLTFCNEDHFRRWTAEHSLPFEPLPDDLDEDEDEGFQYGGVIVVLVVLALAFFGAVSLVRAFV